MINISLKQAIADLQKGEKQYSEQQIKSATRMALNDGVRKGRTEVRRTIQTLYNIKTSRINDPRKDKGLSMRFATNSKLESDLDAGHIPVNLISFQGTKTVRQQVSSNIAISQSLKRKKLKVKSAGKNYANFISVEIIKGQRKTFQTAFSISKYKNAVFARGEKGKPGFIFSNSHMPIDSISTISIYTAAVSIRSIDKYQQQINDYARQRLTHHLERLGNS